MIKTTELQTMADHRATGRCETNPAGQAGYLGPATVVDVNDSEGIVLVEWERGGRPALSWARPALTTPAQFKAGETVLVLSHNLEDFYVIGRLVEGSNEPGGQASRAANHGGRECGGGAIVGRGNRAGAFEAG